MAAFRSDDDMAVVIPHPEDGPQDRPRARPDARKSARPSARVNVEPDGE
jgi:hypothetical protein